MNELFSWDLLITLGGTSIATAILTQKVKNILAKIPTQIVSYAIALILLGGATVLSGQAEHWGDRAIIPLNSLLVSLAANGEYSAIKRIFGE